MSGQIFLMLFFGLVAGVALAWAFFARQRGEKSDGDSQAMMMLGRQLEALSRVVDEKLGATHEAARMQGVQSQTLIRGVQEDIIRMVREMTEVKEGHKQVMGVTDQLQNLQKVLTNQKQRGSLGEASLELILGNILPPTAYKLQHEFKSGEVVDAAIFTKDGIIPVDAKFSLDNYNRITAESDTARREELERDFKNDLKRRIDETAKYIRPEEGTLPFAIMFIPAEGIYYDLLVNEVGAVKVNTRNLIDYAYKDKNVIIVSPTTFSAYLQAVLYGFRAFKIEESAKMIGKRVEELGRHLKAYEDYYNRLGKSLETSVSHYTAAGKELGKIDKDVLRITGVSPELDVVQIEKTKGED